MPMNQYIAPFQQSGSANVPITESTGGQIQGEGALGNLGIIQNASYSGTPQAFADIITDNVFASGNITTGNQLIVTTNVLSGQTPLTNVIPGFIANSGQLAFLSGVGTNQGIVLTGNVVGTQAAGSGNPIGIVISGLATVTALASNSGTAIAAPAGFFFINVPTSGSPWVKVPFYNS